MSKEEGGAPIAACAACGFELWKQVAAFSVSTLGFYSDARFPGRCILRLDEHYDHLDEVSPSLLSAFMENVQEVSRGLRTATGAARVNVAILGNSVPHVHAHLIPRWPELEQFPGKSPWDDPRPREALSPAQELAVLERLRQELSKSAAVRLVG